MDFPGEEIGGQFFGRLISGPWWPFGGPNLRFGGLKMGSKSWPSGRGKGPTLVLGDLLVPGRADRFV